MALISARLHATGDTERYSGLLIKEMAQFKSSHLDLLARSEAVPAAKALYRVGSDDGLDAHVQMFSANVQQLLEQQMLEQRRRAVEGKIVRQRAEAERHRVARFANMELAL